jgi:hypothetical protein
MYICSLLTWNTVPYRLVLWLGLEAQERVVVKEAIRAKMIQAKMTQPRTIPPRATQGRMIQPRMMALGQR